MLQAGKTGGGFVRGGGEVKMCIRDRLGGGIGTAVVGWLLELSGYVGTAETQPESCISMLQFMYLWLPLIFDVLIMFVLSRINVEEANDKIRAKKGMVSGNTQSF